MSTHSFLSFQFGYSVKEMQLNTASFTILEKTMKMTTLRRF